MASILAVRGIEKTSEAFRFKLAQLARALGTNVDWLAAVMSFETKGTFNPAQPNLAGSGATGLIQFLPSTARRLGTSTAALARMSAEEQLDWVWKYLRGFAGRLSNLRDTYLAVFMPDAMGKAPEDIIIRESDGLTYSQNIGFDPPPRKGFITVADITSSIFGTYNAGLSRGRVSVPDSAPFLAPLPPGPRWGQWLGPFSCSRSGNSNGGLRNEQPHGKSAPPAQV